MTDFDTDAVHAGESPDPVTGALDAPVVLSSTFAFESAEDAAAQFAGERAGYIYTRWRNPSVEAFERKMAALEGAESAVAAASGMAAVFGVMAACAGQGQRVVAPQAVYAESARLLREVMHGFGVRFDFVDLRDLAALDAALGEDVALVWCETPANPVLDVLDVAAIAERAHAAGALVAVDSTFATPYHQRPLAQGADLSMHSATKAIGGHGDAVGGVVSGSADLVDRVRNVTVRSAGGALSPFNAFLLTRGLRTLGLRMAKASASALELATRLEEDPRVETVRYPGLPSHPDHDLAARQMERGFGALVAFEVKGGLGPARALYDRLGLISRAVSLGDLRTLATHPAATTHASMPPEQRALAGITDGLLRLSVGIESPEDLWADLDQALRR